MCHYRTIFNLKSRVVTSMGYSLRRCKIHLLDVVLGIIFLTSIPAPAFSQHDYSRVQSFGESTTVVVTSVVSDAAGNTYFGGNFQGVIDLDPTAGIDQRVSAGANDAFIVKLDVAQNYVWGRVVGGQGSDGITVLRLQPGGYLLASGFYSLKVDFDPSSNFDVNTSVGSTDTFISTYGTDGTYHWTRSWGGTGADALLDLQIDSELGIYAVGNYTGTVDFDPSIRNDTRTAVGGVDAYVVKYTVTGEYQWVRAFGGSTNDSAQAIGIDSLDNIILTGYFQTTADFDPSSGVDLHVSGGNTDIFISKLTSGGNYLWGRHLGAANADQANSITVDSSNNIYIVGAFSSAPDFDPNAGVSTLTSAGSTDAFIAKYDTDSNLIWANRFGSTGADTALNVALSQDGQLYTTGYFAGTVDLNPGAGVDNHASAGSNDVFITSLTTAGIYSWGEHFGSTGDDRSVWVSSDSFSNLYLVGQFAVTVDFDSNAGVSTKTAIGALDIFITKYDNAGNYQNVKTLGGYSATAQSLAIALDSTSSSFTAGYYSGTVDFDPSAGTLLKTSTGSNDCYVAKYNSDSTFQWSVFFGGTGDDQITSIAVDSLNNIYISGSFSGTVDFDPGVGVQNKISAGSTDVFLLKLDSTGAFQWIATWGGTGADRAEAITLNGTTDIYIVGTMSTTVDLNPTAGTDSHISAGSTDGFVVKLDATGGYGWGKHFGGTGAEIAYTVELDTIGNVFIGGKYAGAVDFDPGAGTVTKTSAGSDDAFLLSLDSAGLYSNVISWGSTGVDNIRDIAIDTSDNVYITGGFQATVDFDPDVGVVNEASLGSTDSFIAKLSTAGVLSWVTTPGSAGTSSVDTGLTLAVSTSGTLAVGGTFMGTVDFDTTTGVDFRVATGSNDAFVTLYSTTGTYLYTRTMGSVQADTISALAMNAAGDVFATGYFRDTLDFDPSPIYDIRVTTSTTNAAFLWADLVDTTPPAVPAISTPTTGSVLTTLTPTFVGTAALGTIITLYQDGFAFITTVTDGSGNWTVTPIEPLTPGTTNIRADAMDSARNRSAKTPIVTLTLSSSAVAPPLLTSPTTGTISNDTTPTINGTAPALFTVRIYVDGLQDGSVVAAGAGNWQYTISTPLGDGARAITAKAVDALSNLSDFSNTVNLSIDTTNPTVPTITSPTTGSYTSDPTPSISGTSDPGDQITITIDGITNGSTIANGSGDWTFSPSSPLVNGSYAIRARATDAASNSSALSAPVTLHIDTTAPAAPVISSPVSGSSTTDATPTFSGTTQPGNTIAVYFNGAYFDSTTADGAGDWSYTFTVPISDGTIYVSVLSIDSANNASPPSATTTLTLDGLPPAVPVIQTPTEGALVNDNTPTITGSAEPLTTVNVYVNTILEGTSSSDVRGFWTYTVTGALPDGNNILEVQGVDAASNASATGTQRNINVDVSSPLAPSISAPISGTTTRDATPTMAGTAEANSALTIYLDGIAAGQTPVSAGGMWQFSAPTELADATYSVTAKATDLAGNLSNASAAILLTVDLAAPAQPTVSAPVDGTVTSDNTPTITGSAELLNDVTILINSIAVSTVAANGSGLWSETILSALPDGSYAISAYATDGAGNRSAISASTAITVDTTDPVAPTITAPFGHPTTSDATPNIAGYAEVGATVNIYVGGALDGTTTASNTGAWSYSIAGSLADGTHDITARALDAAGNLSVVSTTEQISIDSTDPTTPTIDSPTDNSSTTDTTPIISGTAEALTRILIYLDSVLQGEIVASAGGTWIYSLDQVLPPGSYTVEAKSIDSAGNESSLSISVTFTVDTAAPAQPTISSPVSLTTTVDTTPTLLGSAEADALVDIYLDGGLISTETANGSGVWTFSHVAALSDGQYLYFVQARDLAGNKSLFSNSVILNIDTDAPGTPIILSPANDITTLNNTPTISGTSSAFSTVDLYVNAVLHGSVGADSIGAWSYDITPALADGIYNIYARATDSVGNVSAISASINVTVDTSLPSAPSVTSPVEASFTSISTPLLRGTSEPLTDVELYIDGTLLTTVTSSAGGIWSYTLITPLADATYSLTTIAEDSAGNRSASSPSWLFTIDTAPPATATILTDPPTSTTPDTTPTITGTAESQATVLIFIDGIQIGSTAANVLGNWSYTVASPLTQGAHIISAVVQDAAGNRSADSAVIAVTIDTTAPAIPTLLSPLSSQSLASAQPTFTGLAEASSTVEVNVDSVSLGATVADTDGQWTFIVPSALADGVHNISLAATDLAGNSSADSSDIPFTVDTVTPSAPLIVNPLSQDISRDATPLVSGTAEAGSTVFVYLNGSLIGSTVTSSHGVWSIAVPNSLSEGVYNLDAAVMDSAGNSSPQSTSVTLYMDITAPNSPTMGGLSTAPITNIPHPAVFGTAEPLTSIQLYANGLLVGSTAAFADGNWSYALAPMADGNFQINGTATDSAGNTSTPSSSLSLTVDTIAPAAPTISTPSQAIILQTSRPFIVGTAESSSLITITIDGEIAGTTVCNSVGTWVVQTNNELTEGIHIIAARASDTAGNIGTESVSTSFEISYNFVTRPVITEVSPSNMSNDATPIIGGTAGSGDLVTVYANGAFVGSDTATVDGVWRVETASMSDGQYTLTARASSATGSLSEFSNEVALTVDTIAPVLPVITQPLHNSILTFGNIAITGSAEPNSLVELYIDNALAATISCLPSGLWSYTWANANSEATHVIRARSVDSSGNASSFTEEVIFNAVRPDRDLDGILDSDEEEHGTSADDPDSDDDGVVDGQEVIDHSDPTDPGSHRVYISANHCEEWNGYLGDVANIAEVINKDSRVVKGKVGLLASSGTEIKKPSNIAFGSGHSDILVHEVDGWRRSSYGVYCIKTNASALGQTDGRTIVMKFNPLQKVEFVLPLNYQNPQMGAQYVLYNIMPLNESNRPPEQTIHNWIQIINPESKRQTGVLTVFNTSGVVISKEKFSINSRARRDVSAHRFNGATFGLAEWKPLRSNDKSQLRLVRYYSHNEDKMSTTASNLSTVYDAATAIDGRKGSGREISAFFDTSWGENILEIANVSQTTARIAVKTYSMNGQKTRSKSYKLARKSTMRLNLEKLSKNTSGLVTVEGDAISNTFAQILHTKREDSGELKQHYSLPLVETLGSELSGSYNTFFGTNCSLILSNSTDRLTAVQVSFRGTDGSTPVKAKKLLLGAKKTQVWRFTDNIGKDKSGLIQINPNRSGSIIASVVRESRESNFRYGTLAR